jgi:hypothetical protein
LSCPSLASLSPSAGNKAGNTLVALVGHALDFGAVVVKFNGVPGASYIAVDESHATVRSPAGVVRVRVSEVAGVPLVPGNVLTGDVSGATGTVVSQAAGVVVLSSLSGVLVPGEWLKKTDADKARVVTEGLCYAPCDVTVENEHGMRKTGARLVGAFTFIS